MNVGRNLRFSKISTNTYAKPITPPSFVAVNQEQSSPVSTLTDAICDFIQPKAIDFLANTVPNIKDQMLSPEKTTGSNTCSGIIASGKHVGPHLIETVAIKTVQATLPRTATRNICEKFTMSLISPARSMHAQRLGEMASSL
jgi:hypothetical protein